MTQYHVEQLVKKHLQVIPGQIIVNSTVEMNGHIAGVFHWIDLAVNTKDLKTIAKTRKEKIAVVLHEIGHLEYFQKTENRHSAYIGNIAYITVEHYADLFAAKRIGKYPMLQVLNRIVKQGCLKVVERYELLKNAKI